MHLHPIDRSTSRRASNGMSNLNSAVEASASSSSRSVSRSSNSVPSCPCCNSSATALLRGLCRLLPLPWAKITRPRANAGRADHHSARHRHIRVGLEAVSWRQVRYPYTLLRASTMIGVRRCRFFVYLGLREDLLARRLRAARLACLDLSVFDRLRAALLACFASASCEAADRPSFFRAREAARERLAELAAERCDRPRCTSRVACLRVRALAWPGLGAASFTPARRAFDRPIAIACLVDRAPCLPCRMCSTSSRTNSPACVDGALPSRASRRARSTVCLSGMGPS